MNDDNNKCPDCGEEFEDVFDSIDHMLEDDEEFDPALILPRYRLLIGSLLRCVYRYADEPDMIRSVAQSTYLTLFTAETSPDTLGAVVQDMIVGSSMVGIDDELKELLKDGE
jgi:predicted amidophosphoribosyltransferase